MCISWPAPKFMSSMLHKFSNPCSRAPMVYRSMCLNYQRHAACALPSYSGEGRFLT